MSGILRLRELARIVPLATLTVTVMACGGDSAAPAPPAASGAGSGTTPADACALLTPEEVTQALGEPAGAAEPGTAMPASGPAASMTHCGYRAAGSARSIGVTLWRATDGRYTSTGLDGARQTLREVTGSAPEEITGLGQVAFWGGFQLHVVKDVNTYVIVAPAGVSDETAARAIATTAARAILAK